MIQIDNIKRIAQFTFNVKENLIEKDVRIIRDSIPILWFGNSISYFDSKLKIITVGLNPSNKEFQDDNSSSDYSPIYRFGIKSIDFNAANWFEIYKSSLDNYFKINPYYRWFNTLNPILRGFNAHFGENLIKFDYETNTAIHTDIGSPFATDPTFSELDSYEKDLLISIGTIIWYNLVEILQPDIIIMSGSAKTMDYIKIRFPKNETDGCKNNILNSEKGRTCAYLSKRWGKNIIVVLGRTNITPFGYMNNYEKEGFAVRVMKEFGECLETY